MKKAYFYIDDVIWSLRDLTQKRPKSLFDNPFFGMLKKAMDESPENARQIQLAAEISRKILLGREVKL